MLIRRLTLLGCIALLAIAVTGVVLAATTSVQKEVRITARLLESGKVEFGLQERTDGGEWGDTLLPTKNKFPAREAATVDKWLYSSPVELTPVEFETVDEVMGEDLEVGFGRWADQSSSNAHGDTAAYGVYDEESVGQFLLSCTPSGLPWAKVLTDEYLLNDRGALFLTVYYRVEGGQRQSEEWSSNTDTRSEVFTIRYAQSFARFLSFSATQSTTFYFSVTDRYGDSYHGTFDVTGIHAVLDALPCYSVT